MRSFFITYMQINYRIYARNTEHICGIERGNIINDEQIYSNFSKKYSLGLHPKPPSKK